MTAGERASLEDALALAATVPIIEAFRRAGRFGADGVIRTEGLPHSALLALEYVARITDVVDTVPDGFVVASRYRETREIDFHLDKFVGAYAVTGAFELATGGARATDAAALARGYEALPSPLDSLFVTRVLARQPRCVLDLACGPARIGVELLHRNPHVELVAIDSEAVMCAAARRRLDASGAGGRAQVLHGDVRRLREVVPADVLERVDVVVGASVLNAMFGDGDASAVAFLRQLAETLPERTFITQDYYGALGTAEQAAGRRHALLQDLVQALSGQGVPPPTVEAWWAIIDGAGCRLDTVIHGEAFGIAWFVYEIALLSARERSDGTRGGRD